VNWNGDFHYPNASEDDWKADNKANVDVAHGIKHQDVSTSTNVSELT
jgi:hypothetical protein